MVRYDTVQEKHYKFLYDLLTEREPQQNISHSEMPTYEQHVIFWHLGPFLYAKVIVDDEVEPEIDTYIGYVYVSRKMEVGVFIKKEYQGNTYGENAIKTIIGFDAIGERVFLANINPDNDVSKNLFKKLGFKIIQHTYKKEKDKKQEKK